MFLQTNSNRKIADGYTSPPTTGTWVVGDIVLNTQPNNLAVIGWVCQAAGTPGSWYPFGFVNIPYYAIVTPTNGSAINTNASTYVRTNPASAVTGIILQEGQYAGQEVTIINESASANSITFAASGSNVADGSSDIISGGTARKFIWDSGQLLWYRLQ